MHERDVKSMPILLAALAGGGFVLLLTIGFVLSVARPGQQPALLEGGTRSANSTVTMPQPTVASAHITPRNPDTDPLPTDQQLADMVRRGRDIFVQTGANAGAYVGNALSCTSCHIDGGQKEGALPLVGIAAQFPAYSARDGRLISLEDRIRSCFQRSEAGTAPGYDSPELLAVAAYLTWLSDGQPVGVNPPWRGRNVIVSNHLIPIDQLDPQAGGELYAANCASCHGENGQGQVGPPLWGQQSFNDGAGTGRVYTLAGFIRYAMPLTAPGSLSDDDAQQLAAFIDGHDRPAFAAKDQDYATGKPPVDAVYYPQIYEQNPLRGR